MLFELRIYRPGITGYTKKTNEPIPEDVIIDYFEADSNTHAEVKAAELYKKTGLGIQGHYNVSRA